MGCVASKLDINDVHPNIFAVNNVDDMGTKLSSGQLEITDSDLILYQKGKQPIKWPLKYLKRYGFEAGLFSFEAGRKTPTGPGVYAFKCRRAEKLFNLIQVKVREQPERSLDNRSSLVSTPGALTDTPLTPLSPLTSEPGADPSYINVDLEPGTAQGPMTTAPPSSPGYLNITQELPNTSQLSSELGCHEYENICPDTSTPAPGHLTQHSPSYIPPRNMFVLPPKPSHLQSLSQQHSHQPNVIDHSLDACDEATSDENDNHAEKLNSNVIENSINYIVLDLNQSTSPQSPTTIINTSSSSAQGPSSYVSIDFDKTDALIKSANQRFFEDEPGIRKTRHNSSLSELAPPAPSSSKQ